MIAPTIIHYLLWTSPLSSPSIAKPIKPITLDIINDYRSDGLCGMGNHFGANEAVKSQIRGLRSTGLWLGSSFYGSICNSYANWINVCKIYNAQLILSAEMVQLKSISRFEDDIALKKLYFV